MFTGIITGVGEIVQVEDLGTSTQYGKRLHIAAPVGYLSDVGLGDSIALNGACMTVTSFDVAASQFTIDISAESLNKTSGLGQVGTRLNLEKALRAHDRLGGHIVSGHVDDVGVVTKFERVGESWELRVLCPKHLAKYLANKGSVVINGASLTTNQVQDIEAGCEISINLIPHTIENTAFGALSVGSKVNVEIDTVARYVERMLSLKH